MRQHIGLMIAFRNTEMFSTLDVIEFQFIQLSSLLYLQSLSENPFRLFMRERSLLYLFRVALSLIEFKKKMANCFLLMGHQKVQCFLDMEFLAGSGHLTSCINRRILGWKDWFTCASLISFYASLFSSYIFVIKF